MGKIIRTYDPIGPMRSPLSKRSIAEASADMASVIAKIAFGGDGTVTKDDLHRAGFSNAEIDACHGDAVAAAAQRMKPGRNGRIDIAHAEAA